MNRFFPNYPGYKITSPYGMRTLGGKTRMHNGIDLVAKTASGGSRTDTVTAHTGGTVAAVGYDAVSGHYIKLQTGPTTRMLYCHLKAKPTWKKGQQVATGQALGVMGATGQVTGAHLHFGIQEGSKWIDPAPFLDKNYQQVEEKDTKIPLTTLKRGAEGKQVKALQILLTGLDCRGPMHQPDGLFGPNTQAAVKQFQKREGLTADGVVGEKTWQRLLGVQ